MKVTGGCHCGAIRYEADIDPANVRICHCTDCQILSGSAFRVVVAAPDGVKLLSGRPKIYLKTAESGRKRSQAFCGDCGTPIYSADETNSNSFALRVGTLDNRAELPPTRQVWCRSALDWTMHIEPLVKIAQQDY